MKKEILTLCSLICVGSLSAAWELANDIDDGDITDWTVAFNGESEANPIGSVTVVDDPFGLGQGKVVKIDPGTAGSVNHNVITGFSLENGIVAADGAKATVYFKVGRPTVDGNPGEVDNTFGVGGGVSSPFSYSNYSAYGRYSNLGIMDFRDEGNANGSFQPISAEPQDTDTYYEVWMVIDHWNFIYDVYVKGGSDFPTQTKVNAEDYDYRNQTVEDLTEFFFLASAGNTTEGVKGKDPVYLDDFYVDLAAENLTSPTGGDVTPTASSIVNIATRGKVGDGAAAMIAGFVVEGGTKSVLVQAVGPELADLSTEDDLTAETVLGNPNFIIIPAATSGDPDTFITVDDWSGDEVVTAGAAVGATVLTAGSTSAAVVVDLPEGAYTVAVGGGSGVALVEVYDVD